MDVIGTAGGSAFFVILSGLSQIDSFQLESGGSLSRITSVGQIINPLGGTTGRLNPQKLTVTLSDSSLPGVATLFLNRSGTVRRVFQSTRFYLVDSCWAVSNAGSTWLWTSEFKTRTISLYRSQVNVDVTFISDTTPEIIGLGGLDLAISQNDKNIFCLRVANVNDDSLPIKPYVDKIASSSIYDRSQDRQALPL